MGSVRLQPGPPAASGSSLPSLQWVPHLPSSVGADRFASTRITPHGGWGDGWIIQGVKHQQWGYDETIQYSSINYINYLNDNDNDTILYNQGSTMTIFYDQ